MSCRHLALVTGQKIFTSFFVLWIALTATFVILRLLPGDAIHAQLLHSGASKQDIALRYKELGLDQPIFVQYTIYIKNIVQGNFGISLYSGQAIVDMILPRIGLTLQLALGGMIVAVSIGIFSGIIASLDVPLLSTLSKLFITLIYSVPIFWSSTIVLYVLMVNNRNHLIFAIVILGLHGSGEIARMIQSSLQDISQKPFIFVAQAKGLSNSQIFWKHKLKIALLSILPIIALQAGFVLGGTVIIETVFNLAGIGKLLFNAILNQDYALVQAIALWQSSMYIIVLSFADIILSVLDPRISSV